MRSALAVRIMVLAATVMGGPVAFAVAATSAPPLADVLAIAAKTRRPVLLEFSAVWCAPCKDLAAELAAPTAASTVQRYVVQAYDIERGAGVAVGARYGVTSSIPVLVVVDESGNELTRRGGFLPNKTLAWLDAVAARLALSDAELRRQLAAAPTDADLLKLWLGRALARGDHAEALSTLGKLEANDTSTTHSQAANAAWKKIELTVAWQLQERALPLLVDYLNRYPASGLRALDAFAALKPEAKLRDEKFRQTLDVTTEDSEVIQLANRAVSAGALDVALLAAERIVANDTTDAMRLIGLAEVYRARGDRASALATLDKGLKLPGVQPALIGVLKDRRIATERNQAIPMDDYPPPSVSELLPQYVFERRTSADATKLYFSSEAERLPTTCRKLAPKRLDEYYVRIRVGTAAHASSVEVLEPTMTLAFRRCAEAFLRTVEIPVDTIAGEVVLPLSLAPTAH